MAKKRVVKIRFYMIIVLTIVVGFGAYFLIPKETFSTIKQGTVVFEQQLSAVIVRDEQAFSQNKYGKIDFVAKEGQVVEKDEKVAQVYSWGYSDDVLQELIDIQVQIKRYQENDMLKNVFETDLQTVNSRIGELIDIFSSGGDGIDLVDIQDELIDLMQRQRTLLEKACTPDETLQNLYDREDNVVEKLGQWVSDVNSEAAGTISFYIDGYEEMLAPEKIDALNADDVENLFNDTNMQAIDTSSESQPLYRIVNANKWYCLVMCEEEKGLMVDGLYQISFDRFVDQPYTARLMSERKVNDQVLYVFEINDSVGPLLNVRNTMVTIQRSYQGLTVNENAITERDGVKVIILDVDGEEKSIPVEVMYSDGETSIIKKVEGGANISEGMTVKLF